MGRWPKRWYLWALVHSFFRLLSFWASSGHVQRIIRAKLYTAGMQTHIIVWAPIVVCRNAITTEILELPERDSEFHEKWSKGKFRSKQSARNGKQKREKSISSVIISVKREKKKPRIKLISECWLYNPVWHELNHVVKDLVGILRPLVND